MEATFDFPPEVIEALTRITEKGFYGELVVKSRDGKIDFMKITKDIVIRS